MDKLNHLIVNLLVKKGVVLNYPLILGVWTVFFLLVACLFPIRFETNDDVVMLMISSGVYSGTPDFHLVFINVVYGFLVKSLYTIMPGLEWYTILFCLLHIISFSLVFWVYSKRITKAFGQVLLLLLLLVLQSRFIIGLQFTTTAAIIACAGLSLYFERGKLIKVWGLVLFLIGSLIRFEAAMLCLGVFAPVMMFPLSGRIRSKRQFLQTGLILLFILILPVTAQIFNRQVYTQDLEWRYYFKYNRVRGALNDNPNFGKLVATESTCSIAEIDDLKNLANFIPDPSVLDLETITVLKKALDTTLICGKIQNIAIWIQDYLDTIVLIVVLVLLLLLERKVTYCWSLSFLVLIFIALLSFVSLNATVKERVFLSAITPLMLVLCLIIVNYQQKKLKTVVLSCLYLLVLGTIIRQSIDLYKIQRHKRMLICEQINLIRQTSDYEITPFGATLVLEGLAPFDITSKFKLLNCKLVVTGWMTRIPLNNGRLGSHLDFVEKPVFIFTDKASMSAIHNIQNCIRKNYQIETASEVVAEDDSFEIIVLKKQRIEN